MRLANGDDRTQQWFNDVQMEVIRRSWGAETETLAPTEIDLQYYHTLFDDDTPETPASPYLFFLKHNNKTCMSLPGDKEN